MKRQHLPLYAIALAILIVGLAFAGVPVTTLLIGLAVLACPLMMMVMMGGHSGSNQQANHDHEHRPTTGQR